MSHARYALAALTAVSAAAALTILGISLLNCDSGSQTKQAAASWATKYFAQMRAGANVFNQDIPHSLIVSATIRHIAFVRLAPDKFTCRSGDAAKRRDFLLGDADNFTGIVKEDLAYLISVLDRFHAKGVKAVLTMLSLPGSRWKQHNNDHDDLRIWQDNKYMAQAAAFWRELAGALKDHPAVAAVNPLNEPHPVRLYTDDPQKLTAAQKQELQEKLYRFNSEILKAIREAAPAMTVIFDGDNFADPQAFAWLKPMADDNVIYGFHMYEPYTYTNRKRNNGRYTYPGVIEGVTWNRQAIEQYLEPVKLFQKTHKLPAQSIIAGEFGGHRMSKGLNRYFDDIIAVCADNRWSWAVYSFREDTWDGMDYEQGDKATMWRTRDEPGKERFVPRFPDNPVFKTLRKGWTEVNRAGDDGKQNNKTAS